MRKSREDTQKTRDRIMTATSKLLRERGFDGFSISDLMGPLKLTNGGFYRHFDSKEALCIEALSHGFTEARAHLMAKTRTGPHSALRQLIHEYLSLNHLANPGLGCPIAALSADTGRASDTVQQTFDQELGQHIATFLPLMPGLSEAEQRRNVLVLFSGMAGALSTARAVSDPALKSEILDAALTHYIQSFCTEDSSTQRP